MSPADGERPPMRSSRLLQSAGAAVRAGPERPAAPPYGLAYAALEAVPSSIAVLDREGVIVSVNEAWRRFAQENGAPALVATGIGTNYLKICREAEGPSARGGRAAAAGIAAVLDGSRPRFALEYPCHSPTEQRLFLLQAAPLAGGQGGAVVSHTDVTERARLQRELAEREGQVEGIFGAVADGIALHDTAGHIVRANAAYRRLLGPDTAELGEEGPPPEDGRPLRRILRGETLADEKSIDVRVRADDGREMELSVGGASVRDRLGHVVGAVVSLRDVTERRRLERELAERANQMKSVYDAMVDGLIVFDADGRVLTANPSLLRLLGLEAADAGLNLAAGGMSYAQRHALFDLRDTQGRPLPLGDDPMHRILRGETLMGADVFDVCLHTIDGRDVEISVSGAPVRDREGTIVGAVCTVRDVTERIRLERERAHVMDIVSHELKTPLNTLRLGGDLIRRYVGRDKPAKLEILAETLAILESGVTLMERLVNDLVDAARMDMGHLALSLAPTDVARLARRAAREHMELTGRSVIVEAPQRGLKAMADRVRIGQVLTNLLANALKYSPPGAPVRLRLRRAHGRARFEVQDDGPGIPREAQARIFERFYQIPSIKAQHGSGAGLGLGLYICRQLVELHEGSIGVDSDPGRGSTFWFTLPLARADA